MPGARKNPKRQSTSTASATRLAAPQDSGSLRARHVFLLLSLAAVTLIAYWRSFQSQFVLDNALLLLNDARIRELTWDNLRLIFSEGYWYKYGAAGLYRPLTTLSYLFNYSFLGNATDPAGYHWINFLLHVTNMALLYLLGLRIFRRMEQSLAFAAIWGLHPIATESVTNIAGRADLLAGFGILAGMLCYLRATETEGRRPVWILLLLCAATIGIFSKESAAVLPAGMLIYDLAFGKAPWRVRAPAYVSLAPPFIGYFMIRNHVLTPAHFVFGDNPLLGAGFLSSRLTAIKVIGKYLWLLIWPAEQSYDYSYNQVPVVTDWKSVIALAACVSLALLAIVCYRRSKPVFFLIVFFFVTLAPTANIFMLIGAIMAERFLYLPSIAFAGCVVLAMHAGARYAASRWGGSPAMMARAAMAAVCVALAARTYARNLDWLDSRSLAASGVEACPRSFKTHMMQAAALLDTEGVDGSIREISEAMRILDPLPDAVNVAAVYINAGAYYRLKGDRLAPKKREGIFAAAPESRQWYERSRDVLLRARKIESALAETVRRQAPGKVSFQPRSYQVDLELGRTYLRLSAVDQSLESLQAGLQIQVAPELLAELSEVYKLLGQPRQAILALIEARTVNPVYPGVTPALVSLYRAVDAGGCSVRVVGRMAELNADCPAVRADICTAHGNLVQRYAKLGDAQAVEATRAASARLGCPARN